MRELLESAVLGAVGVLGSEGLARIVNNAFEMRDRLSAAAQKAAYLIDSSSNRTTGTDASRLARAMSTRCRWCVKKSTCVLAAS